MFLRCTESVQLSAHLYSIKHVWEKLHWRYFLDLIKNVRPSLFIVTCPSGITRRESLGQNVHTLDPCKYLVLYFQIWAISQLPAKNCRVMHLLCFSLPRSIHVACRSRQAREIRRSCWEVSCAIRFVRSWTPLQSTDASTIDTLHTAVDSSYM